MRDHDFILTRFSENGVSLDYPAQRPIGPRPIGRRRVGQQQPIVAQHADRRKSASTGSGTPHKGHVSKYGDSCLFGRND